MKALLPLLCLLLAATSVASEAEPHAVPAAEEEALVEAPTKNARLAIAASALFPGLGQLYNEEGLKTLAVFVWESYYIATILRVAQEADLYRRRAATLGVGETWNGLDHSELRSRFHAHEDRQRDYIWYGSALFLASILDAYVFAHLYSFETDGVRTRSAGILPVLDPSERAVGLQLRLRF